MAASTTTTLQITFIQTASDGSGDSSTKSISIKNPKPKAEMTLELIQNFVGKLDTAYDYVHTLKTAAYVDNIKDPVTASNKGS